MLRFADTSLIYARWCCMVCCLTVLEIVADEVLFRWAPNRSKLLREFWEDYMLVMETLEENQVENPPQDIWLAVSSYRIVMYSFVTWLFVCRFMSSGRF